MECKFLKSANDFIIGIALLALGVYVLVTKDIVTGNIITGDGGLFVRPDVYVRLLGGFLTFFSAVLVLKSIKWTRRGAAGGGAAAGAGEEKLKFVISREVIFTLSGLIVYAALLELTLIVKNIAGMHDGIGFFIATFLLIVFLTVVFRRKEKYGEGFHTVPRAALLREFGFIVIYAAVLDVVVWAVFSKVLNVSLP